MDSVSAYQVLGITKRATKQEIKTAYRNLAKQYHPDKNPENDTKEKFQQLKEIYEILIDDEKRELYDKTGSISLCSGDNFFNKDFDTLYEFFKSFFVPVTTEAISEFEDKYRFSNEEKEDVIKTYIQFKGDMNKIIKNVMCSNNEDRERFSQIINNAITERKLQLFPKFKNQVQFKKKNKENEEEDSDGVDLDESEEEEEEKEEEEENEKETKKKKETKVRKKSNSKQPQTVKKNNKKGSQQRKEKQDPQLEVSKKKNPKQEKSITSEKNNSKEVVKVNGMEAKWNAMTSMIQQKYTPQPKGNSRTLKSTKKSSYDITDEEFEKFQKELFKKKDKKRKEQEQEQESEEENSGGSFGVINKTNPPKQKKKEKDSKINNKILLVLFV